MLFTVNVPYRYLEDLRAKLGDDFEFTRSSTKEEALTLAKRAEVLVMIAPNKDIVSVAKNCKWIHALTAGVEDYLALSQIRDNPSITLTNSSGIHAIQISEHVFALLLAFTRNIKTVILDQERRRWTPIRLGTKSFEVGELGGRTMGIFGLGSIGLEIARKAKVFGMKTIGIRKDVSKEIKNLPLREYVDQIFSEEESNEVLSRFDVIVNALPLTNETRGYFGSARFAKMKSGCIFINIGRGLTVVEADLIETLKLGRLSAVALDVFEVEPLPETSELWTFSNVIVSPHIGGWTPNYYEKAHPIVEENLRRYARGEILRNLVDKVAGY